MSKFTTMFVIALLFLFTLSSGARPEPAVKTQYEGAEPQHVDVEESCKGVGEEECLMRRTLAAHLDYIYTQKHKP
ncbi:phytosulfokines-like [Olea europaea var. sylvestris]|uniref:Phytosulfokine n=1 Tax=Olea europaea subsp. europaea TaxID=158383 RepID=A0A8S0U265_OLEEU|nr:phytosulfokines-like [Olea europaea var. sylvestris]CAA3011439.1 phytosulfokines-like [Olea europaea subsp. europaea]